MAFFLLACAGSTPERKIMDANRQTKSILRSLYPTPNFPPLLTASRLDSLDSAIEIISLTISENQHLAKSKESLNILSETKKTVQQIKFMAVQARTNPAFYRLGTYLDHVPPGCDSTLELLGALIQIASPYYSAAKINLLHPNPQQCMLAVELHRQDLDYLKHELPLIIAETPESAASKNALLQELFHAEISFKDYIAFCKSKYLNHLDSLRHGEKNLK
jgi:hypothetical protein